jgi:hypothetical protein
MHVAQNQQQAEQSAAIKAAAEQAAQAAFDLMAAQRARGDAAAAGPGTPTPTPQQQQQPPPPAVKSIPWSELEPTGVTKGAGTFGVASVYKWRARALRVVVKELKAEVSRALRQQVREGGECQVWLWGSTSLSWRACALARGHKGACRRCRAE